MLHDCHYVVFDLETGGFKASQNPITQIAAIVLDSNLKEKERYSTYVKPYDNLALTEGALDYTKTTRKMLDEKGVDIKKVYQDFSDLLTKYKKGIKKVVLIGHNASRFDMPFIHYIFDKFKDDVFKYAEEFIFDTMAMSRLQWGHLEVSNHKLESACERAGIELSDAHEAMNDTEANAKLFKFFALQLRGGDNGIIGEPAAEEFKREFQF